MLLLISPSRVSLSYAQSCSRLKKSLNYFLLTRIFQLRLVLFKSRIEIAKAIKSNINPSTINVYVGGRVELPGKYQVGRTSTLNDAIAVSGGTKVLKGSTRLIRYNNDGSVEKRKFRYNKRAKSGSEKNPFLKNGDIIFVGKSGFNIATEVLNEATSPLQSLVSVYGIYKVFD